MDGEGSQAYLVQVINRLEEQGRRQEALGRRIDATDAEGVECRAKIDKVDDEVNVNSGRINAVERDIASIKTTLKLVGGGVVLASPIFTALLIKVIG